MPTPSTFMDYLTVQGTTEYNGLAVFPIVLVSSAFEAKNLFEVIGNGNHNDNIKPMETGEMNFVQIENRGELPALVLDGSILIGGAANRMLTASAVIRKDETVNLPVVSVEEKRWECENLPGEKTRITASSPEFSSSIFAPSSLRRLRLEKSILAMKKEGVSRVNQNIIWKHITKLFEKSSLTSDNFDVCELYNYWEYLIEEYRSRIKSVNRQVGCIVFIDRKTWYLDIFYNPGVFDDLFPNLLNSYAMEAIIARVGLAGEEDYHWVPELMDAQDAFAKIKLIKLNPLKATGRKGEEIGFFASKNAWGTVLTDGPDLMHVAACSRSVPVARVSRSNTQKTLSGA